MGHVQHLRVLDVGRPFGRRVRHRRQPVRAGTRRLAGAGRPARRDLDRQRVLQPRRQAVAGDRGPVSGDQPQRVRGQGREHPGDRPRSDRGLLVRDPDLPGVSRARRRPAEAVPRPDAVRVAGRLRLPRPAAARMGQLRVPVGSPGARLLAGNGVDPPVHRLLRAGRLRGDVPAVRLHDPKGRLQRGQPESTGA